MTSNREVRLVTHLLYFSEQSVGALDLPLAQLSERHLLEINLRTAWDEFNQY